MPTPREQFWDEVIRQRRWERQQEIVHCSCGRCVFLADLTADGHCPRCGFADEHMTHDEWITSNRAMLTASQKGGDNG